MPSEFLQKFKLPVLVLLTGILVISLGILFYKGSDYFSPTKVEILSTSENGNNTKKEITVEIAGEVIKPAVYKLMDGSRVDDLVVASGGFSAKADREWTDKYLNRASKLTDGQKVFIPQKGGESAKVSGVDQSVSTSVLGQKTNLVNINTASATELDKLSGIGQVYAQKIIEQRPYSTIEELMSKKVLPKSTYEKIKNNISIY